MGARWYDAALGRWTSADTVVPEPGNPQAFNRYSYCLANPLKFRDPTGHLAEGEDDEGDLDLTLELLLLDEDDLYWYLHNTNDEWEVLAFGVGTFLLVGGGGVVLADLGSLLLGSATAAVAETASVATTAACADTDCTNEIKSAWQISQRGQRLVLDFLSDPAAQEEVRVYVNEAGRRANYFARFDILTRTAIHEVKNVAALSLSQGFMEQATRYKMIADSAGLELHYWLVNSAPQHVVNWLEELGAIVHMGIPGQ